MGNEISMHIKGQVQRNATTLLALSTVAMGGVEPGTMVVAARDDGNTFLHDLTEVFGEDGTSIGSPSTTEGKWTPTATSSWSIVPSSCTAGRRAKGGPGSR